MFTGIIQEIGILKKKIGDGRKNPVHLVISNKKLKFQPGESVSVNGVCLTVTQQAKNGFEVDVIPETLRRSNFAQLIHGAALNLEPSMKAADRFHGHFVSGHVDATVKVLGVEKNKHKASLRLGLKVAPFGRINEVASLRLGLPKKLAHFVAEKGSVALNGVSLTVTKVMRIGRAAARLSNLMPRRTSGQPYQFVVALIPYTLKHTNLGRVKSGDFVNIEIDMMARYGSRSPEIPRRGAVKIAIVTSKFNKKISDRLLAGALQALRENKFPRKNIEIFRAPGAFEIPFFIQKLIAKKYSGFLALGCVIRGETDHYRAVCDGVIFGIQKISMENRVPVMFGVLMCRTRKQALERSRNDTENKGYECGKGLMEILKDGK